MALVDADGMVVVIFAPIPDNHNLIKKKLIFQYFFHLLNQRGSENDEEKAVRITEC